MVVPILNRIGIGVGAATLLVVGVGLMLPRTWTVSRTVQIDAPRARVHALCADLHEWPAWAPWFRADPALRIETGDVTSGAGAHESWQGESDHGHLTFTRSDPDWGVAYDITNRRLQARCAMRYAEGDSGRIAVTWEMTGDTGWNFMDRYLGRLMGPIQGPLLDDGLERLKLVAEGKAPAVGDSLRTGATVADD